LVCKAFRRQNFRITL